jgi:uncharacterized protein YkwD
LKILLILGVFLLLAGLVGGAIDNRQQISDWWDGFAGITRNTPETISEYETLFNQYRVDHGRKPLIFTDDLNRLAALRLEEIKGDYSHKSEGDYNYHLAENIIDNINNNDMAIRHWGMSVGHKLNMLDPDFIYTGYATDHGYAVQLFSTYETIDGVPQLPPGYHWPDEEK